MEVIIDLHYLMFHVEKSVKTNSRKNIFFKLFIIGENLSILVKKLSFAITVIRLSFSATFSDGKLSS